jgi:hypothetical protein
MIIVINSLSFNTNNTINSEYQTSIIEYNYLPLLIYSTVLLVLFFLRKRYSHFYDEKTLYPLIDLDFLALKLQK